MTSMLKCCTSEKLTAGGIRGIGNLHHCCVAMLHRHRYEEHVNTRSQPPRM